MYVIEAEVQGFTYFVCERRRKILSGAMVMVDYDLTGLIQNAHQFSESDLDDKLRIIEKQIPWILYPVPVKMK
jgi:hypothetical protein